MSSVYFYTGVIGFTFGVGIASLFSVGFAYIAWMVMVAGILGLISRRGGEAPSSGNLVLLSIFLITCSLGMIRFGLASLNEYNLVYESQLDTQIILEGVVAREPDVREKTTNLYVQVDDELLLVKTHRYAAVSYGDRVVVEGNLQKPTSFETDLGRTFDYLKYLQARGVTYTVSFAEVVVTESNQGNPFIQTILEGKKYFMHSIEQVLPEPQVGLAEGLLLGVKQALGDELEAIFRKTGIIHIVVLSGYNVMLVVIFITYILSYILPYRFQAIFGVGAIICFAILVGLSATVVRASVMASLLLFARASGHTYAVMRALVFAGIVMVLINPYLLVYDVGFQLSFIATLGLISLASHIEKQLQFMPTLFDMRGFLTATISTQIFVMPILLYNIGELSVVSIVVNVLVLPMVPVAMLLTFITGLLGFVSVPLAALSGFATHLSLSYILLIATFFSQVPFASFSVPAFPFWVVIASYALMGYVVYRLQNKKSTRSIEKSSLTSWTLEEEKVVTKKLASVVHIETDASELPIFFR